MIFSDFEVIGTVHQGVSVKDSIHQRALVLPLVFEKSAK